MQAAKPETKQLTTQEKLDLIAQIEASMVPGAPDIDEKMERIGDLWESIEPKQFSISDELLAELEQSHEEYMRDPSIAKSWEEVKAWILNRDARRSHPAGRGNSDHQGA